MACRGVSKATRALMAALQPRTWHAAARALPGSAPSVTSASLTRHLQQQALQHARMTSADLWTVQQTQATIVGCPSPDWQHSACTQDEAVKVHSAFCGGAVASRQLPSAEAHLKSRSDPRWAPDGSMVALLEVPLFQSSGHTGLLLNLFAWHHSIQRLTSIQHLMLSLPESGDIGNHPMLPEQLCITWSPCSAKLAVSIHCCELACTQHKLFTFDKLSASERDRSYEASSCTIAQMKFEP